MTTIFMGQNRDHTVTYTMLSSPAKGRGSSPPSYTGSSSPWFSLGSASASPQESVKCDCMSYLKHYTQDGEIHRGLPGPCRQTMGLDSETETDSQWEHCKTYQFANCEMLNRSCSWQQTRSAIELRQKYRWGVEGHEPQQRRWHRGLDWYKEAQA
jgi:hypothetical protein